MVEPVSEAVLIEIMQRFRRLEESIERADLFLASREERLRETIDALEAKHVSGKMSYNAWCRAQAQPESELTTLTEEREHLEKCLDTCRDDMNRMQDEIRSRQRSMAA